VLRLELVDITKRYPQVVASDRVSLRVAPGEIHAVLGENGAGKSTLMKVIYGAVTPDEGELRWNGQRVQIARPGDARALGIRMVFQHGSLFDTLTVAENVWLGLGKSHRLADVAERLAQVSRAWGLELEARRPVHTLSVGERQRVELVRALMTEPKLLILDEPTSVLAPGAVEQLFGMLRRLAERDCSILFISHKLDEIRALCHRCTVLRAGRVAGEVDPAAETNASLSRLMIGAVPPPLPHRQAGAGDVVLAVRDLALPAPGTFGTALHGVSFEVRAGEILGVAGISGNGQRELLAALSGEDRRAAPAAIQLFGAPIGRASVRARRRAGLRFVPEERLGRGAVPSLSLAQNTLLSRGEAVGAGGWIRTGALAALARHLIERFHVKAAGPGAAAQSLSGGNLQKFLVGRELDAAPRLLLASQPTWGVDVGAAAQIRGELLALRDAGCAILVVSEELDELFEIADRLIVIAGGRVSPSVARADASVAQLGSWMSGLWTSEAQGEGRGEAGPDARDGAGHAPA
jgi:ABC-type uncharacterized transport system ATPase subunit